MDPLEKKSVIIVFAEDDDADYKLASRALEKLHLVNKIDRVKDGQELIDYLKKMEVNAQQQAKHACIVFLDLNMPRKDGREALKEIKTNNQLKHIPIIIMTTSKAEEDVVRSYQLGVNAYIRKPIKQDEFMDMLSVFKRFWLDIVELPFEGEQ